MKKIGYLVLIKYGVIGWYIDQNFLCGDSPFHKNKKSAIERLNWLRRRDHKKKDLIIRKIIIPVPD